MYYERHKNKIEKFMVPGEYYTVSFLSRKLKISEDQVVSCLENRDDLFGKSLMRTDSGKDVYVLKTRFWKIKDIWNTICYINYLKY